MLRSPRLLALALAGLLLLGCRAGGPAGARAAEAARPAPGTGPRSNVLRGDYAGSESCASCHAAIYEAWRRSPMHNMTRLPADAAVRAPFDGGTFRFKQDSAVLDARGGERFMRLSSSAFGEHLYRVTKVIGGHHREDFAGIEVTGLEPDARVLGNPHDELVLPVSFVYEAGGALREKGYSVMVTERPGLRAGGVWNRTCVLCHNTAPLFTNLLGPLHGPGLPGYQGEVVDRILPRDRRLAWRVTDADALGEAVRAEIRFLGGTPAGDDGPALLAQAAAETRLRLDAGKFVELGIGCESCHGGSREHVQRNDVRPSFMPTSSFLAPAPAGGAITRPEWINRACARCHQVLFSRYPYTWEGGVRRQSPGGSHTNSGEARDFLLGGCARAMSCNACHDPHAGSSREALAALATPAGNRVCVTCHQGYATPAALRAHAHHDPAGAGGACIACHMPRKNVGLGYELVRYHRIGSPNDPARVERDRPLECALCHPRARVGELAADMERFWGKRTDRAALERLYGSLQAEVLTATAVRGKPHEQATAYAALGEARVREAVPLLAGGLMHDYPLVRYYARHALERTLGRPVPIDVQQDRARIQAALAGLLGDVVVTAPAAPAPRAPGVLDDPED
jgi:predicted CXXCH cytochrome family protein